MRESAILINLLHIRALIKYNRVLLFDAYGSADSYTQSVFMYDLEGKLQQREGSRQAGGLPYEFRALEAVLISVTAALEGEFEAVREPVVKVLRELEEDIDRAKLRHLLIYSKMLGTFEQKAKLVRDAIDELLDADDDLAAMYLTEKANGGRRGEDDHTEVEMLLESYHKLCDEIVQVSGNLVSNIRNTEEMYILTLLPPMRLANTCHQRQSHPRRKPQLAHAARPEVLHRHPRHRDWRAHSRLLRHEPEELHRGVRLRLRRRLGLLRCACRLRVGVRALEATSRAARQDVGRAGQGKEGQLARPGFAAWVGGFSEQEGPFEGAARGESRGRRGEDGWRGDAGGGGGGAAAGTKG